MIRSGEKISFHSERIIAPVAVPGYWPSGDGRFAPGTWDGA